VNEAQLAALGQNALAWSRCYVALKNALVKEGVPLDEAVEVARDVTNLAGLFERESGDPCPLCGR
jgi:pseudouridine-5'-phosphate glycosidase